MKKKIFLIAVIAFVFAVLFAFAVSADTIHTPEKLAKYGTIVTVRITDDDPDGTTVNLFDNEGNALIWYLDANNELQSIRADDSRVKYQVESWGEVTSISIVLDENTTIGAGKFVVFNVLDDDVVMNHGYAGHFGASFNYFKLVFQGCTNLEYVYLRLDTKKIQRQSFNGCSNLKYINLEDLTEIERIGDGQQFSNCGKLFVGHVLDLSRLTKLTSIDNGGTFNAVPLAGAILPDSCTTLSTWTFQSNPTTSFRFYSGRITALPGSTFKNCTKLQTVYLNGTLSSIGDNAFLSCNALTTICFVGTKDQLKTLIANTSATGNTPFLNVAGALGENGEYENVISYADYLKLSDEQKSSGKYAIYNYSYCEAYNNSIHTPVDNANDCTKKADCKVCGLEEVIEAEFESHDYLESFVYENGFAQAGVYTYICQNSDKCTCGNIYKDYDALFVADGFSTKGNDGISAGYTVNPEVIAEYNRVNSSNPISFGVMMVSPTCLADKDSFFANGKVNSQKHLQVDMSDLDYKNFSVYITGFTGTARNASLVMALYVCDSENNVEFVQSQVTPCADKSVTLGEVTLYTVTLDSVTNESTIVGNLKDYFAKEDEE